MRILPIVTAAAIGLVASYGLASAQATNTAPQSGTAKTLSATGADTAATDQKAAGQKAMAKGKKKVKKTAPKPM